MLEGINMTFYERFETLRKERGISQGKLEKELGFSNGSISKWKNSTPTAERLQKLADYFGVSIQYLMNGEEPATKSVISLFEGPKVLQESLNQMYETEFRVNIEQILDEILSDQQREEFKKEERKERQRSQPLP